MQTSITSLLTYGYDITLCKSLILALCLRLFNNKKNATSYYSYIESMRNKQWLFKEFL